MPPTTTLQTASFWRLHLPQYGRPTQETMQGVQGLTALLTLAQYRGIQLKNLSRVEYFHREHKSWIQVSKEDLQAAIASLSPTGGDAA